MKKDQINYQKSITLCNEAIDIWKQDEKKAKKLFQEAYNLGLAEAAVNLGVILIEKDLNKAAKLFKFAAMKAVPEGLYNHCLIAILADKKEYVNYALKKLYKFMPEEVNVIMDAIAYDKQDILDNLSFRPIEKKLTMDKKEISSELDEVSEIFEGEAAANLIVDDSYGKTISYFHAILASILISVVMWQAFIKNISTMSAWIVFAVVFFVSYFLADENLVNKPYKKPKNIKSKARRKLA
jgi:hypothetical protein